MKAEEIREMFDFNRPGYDPAIAFSRERAQIAALGEIAAQLADSNELQREEIARRGTADKNVKLERERKTLSNALLQSQRLLIDLQAAAKAAGGSPHHLLPKIIANNEKLLTDGRSWES